MKTLRMNLGERSYDITVGQDLLGKAHDYFDLDRKVLILTDSGVPKEYAETLLSQCKCGIIHTVPHGEASKSMEMLTAVLQQMMKFDMTRGDALISVGGGVVGDLGGFAAACYMRGIDFYQVPTTLLAQVDSSIGGKCAVNLGGTKNIVGAFYQPKGVLIDTKTLSSLPKRLLSAGLAEAVKMSLTSDRELFTIFETEELTESVTEKIILRSLMIKKSVVEEDEKESGLRKILNFGHTLGHAIEAQTEMKDVYHGECVAIGMLPMCSEEVRCRLLTVMEKLGLPSNIEYDLEKALAFVVHDKKCHGGFVDVVMVEEIGSFVIQKMTVEDFGTMVKEVKERMGCR